jgi:hypothetical protein
MKGILGEPHLRARYGRFILLGIALVIGSIGLIAVGQPLAALLVVIVGVLLADIEHRNARTRALAQHIVTGESLEKLEVPAGAWGDLCRAINRLVQEQRLQARLRTIAPQTLPDDGVRAFIDGTLPSAGETRAVAVLMLSCSSGPRRLESRGRHSALAAWQLLADATQRVAYQHNAMLQPCGDAIMLVFGAFAERPLELTLRDALDAAESLREWWRESDSTLGKLLAISVTSGPALVTTLPGLGCCVLGSPVEQAIQIERLALTSPYYRLLCDESSYYTLRRDSDNTWRPTEFRIQSGEGRAQVVYGLNSV